MKTENTNTGESHREAVVEPWRLQIRFECGTHWYNFWRRGAKFRTYGYEDETGWDIKGFAVGAVMVSWGKRVSYRLVQS